MSFQARYESRCADCGETIHVGDVIESRDDEVDFWARYAHVDCDPSDPITLKPTEVVCGDCWLVKPCECEVS